MEIGADAFSGQAVGLKGLQVALQFIRFAGFRRPGIGVVVDAHIEVMRLGEVHLGLQRRPLREVGRIDGIGQAVLQRTADQVQGAVAVEIVEGRHGVGAEFGPVIALVVLLVQGDIAVEGKAALTVVQENGQISLKEAHHQVLVSVTIPVHLAGGKPLAQFRIGTEPGEAGHPAVVKGDGAVDILAVVHQKDAAVTAHGQVHGAVAVEVSDAG